jgi:AcrR family transcriptional regulator
LLRSRAALRQALLSLIKEKAFEQISVREIALRAGVTFPTFYRQFATKEALLSEIATDELSQMASLMSSHIDQRNVEISARAICEYVEERRPLWTALLTTSAAAVMREEFIKLTCNLVEDRKRINPELPADMIASFVVSSMFEILGWWLRQPEGYPIELAAQYLELLVLTPATSRHTLRSA